jgi:multicomponent Na+:H+ antiporter subunit A
MPLTGGAAVLAALSMAGLPPLFGFIGKELFYRATLEAPLAASLLTVAALLTNVLLVVSAGIIGFGPFFGKQRVTAIKIHESHFSLWIGPVLLAGLGIFIGLFPNFLAGSVVSSAVAAVLAEPIVVRLGLLHGLTLQLLFSGITFALGIVAYFRRDSLLQAFSRFDLGKKWGASSLYELALDGMKDLAHFQTRIVQCGHLHVYLLITIATTIGLVGFSIRKDWNLVDFSGWSDIRFHELLIAVVILGAILVAVRASSRLLAVAALGVVGYSMVFIYVLFGAPDLAMTQFSIDTLTVMLLVLVLHRLPRYVKYSKTADRIRDGLPALAAGALITMLIMAALALPVKSTLAPYFAENAYELAKGRNIVNVILVDFRAMDTMGEITVLAVAAIGVYSLLKLRLRKDGSNESNDMK